MKLTLRSLAIAAALTVSGTMFAQYNPTPTVTQKWIKKLGFKSGDFRTGSGVNGKIYMAGGSIIKVIDEAGIKDNTFSGKTFNKGLTADDAGNLFVLKGWPSSETTTNAFLISSDMQTIKEVTLAKPTNDQSFPIGRSDNQGRAVGNFFSEEGGAFFLTSAGNNKTDATSTQQEYPICIKFKNGVPVAVENSTKTRCAKANTGATAVPSVETMAELEYSAKLEDCFYYRSTTSSANVYVGATGKTLTAPTYPKNYTSSSQYGFDVFTLAGEIYQVRPMVSAAWGPDFGVSNSKGNVLFHTQYASDYVGTNAGNSVNLVARKVSDYKVEIYQIYTASDASKSFAAMYEITIPEPDPLYIVGEQMGWDEPGANTAKFGFDMKRKTYVYKNFEGGDIKISTATGSWNAFNGSTYYPADGSLTLEPNKTYNLAKSTYDKGNITIPEGNYTIEVSDDFKTLKVIGEETYTKRGVYIVGDLNEWTLSGDKFTYEDGYFVYTGFTGGEFKLAVGANTTWPAFNANIIYTTDGTTKLVPNQEYTIKKMSNNDAQNFIVPKGEYTIKISEKLETMIVSGQVYVEEKDVYLVGEVNNWTLPGTLLEFDGTNYVCSGFTGGGFKLAFGSTTDWNVFNAKTIYTTDNTLSLLPNKKYYIEKKQMEGAPNLVVPEGEYTVMIDSDFLSLTVSGKQNIYITGDFNEWGLPGEELEFDGEKYTYSGFAGSEFKISACKAETGDWKKFNANALYPTDGTLAFEPNKTYAISKPGNKDNNMTAPYGEYTVQIDKLGTTLTLNGHEKFVPQPLYLIGEFNEWAEPGVPFLYNSEPIEGKVVYTIDNLPALTGEFLVAGDNYKPKYAGATFAGPSTQALKRGHDINNKCNTGLSEVSLTFAVPVDDPANATLTIESNSHYAIDGRKPYAYNLSIEWIQWNNINVTFNASAPAEGGEVVFIDSTGKEYVKTFGAIDGGVNTIPLDNYNDGLPAGEHYTWGVRLKGKSTGTAPTKVSETSLPIGASEYMGIAVIKDPESEAFGYTVIGMSGQHGYMVFDQSGALQYGGPIHAQWQKNTFSNGGSNTMFGDSYMGYAVFANWNNTAAGYWAVNPLDPNEEPYNMLASPGATMASSGLWSLNGTAIGGGSSCVAFANLGEETLVVCFDEDYAPGNRVQTHRIKTGDKYITTTPKGNIGSNGSGFVGVAASTKGYFVAQNRAAANDATYPALRFFDLDNNLLYNTGDDGCALVTCTGSVACSTDGSLMAMTDYNGTTHIYEVTYAPMSSSMMRAPATTGTPSFKEIGTVKNNSVASSRIDLAFDAANNLHVADRKVAKYSVYSLPGETSSFTAAPAGLSFELLTGVEDVTVDDAAEEAEPEYYTLQGIRVDGSNLTPGIYIRRQGNTSSKIYIR